MSPLRTTRASLTVAEASRPAEIKLMAVPGRRRGGVRHQTVPAERGAGRGEQRLIRSNASRSLVPLATWRAAAPWPRTDRHSLMILIDTGAPSRREAVRATNESQRNQPSSDPARPT